MNENENKDEREELENGQQEIPEPIEDGEPDVSEPIPDPIEHENAESKEALGGFDPRNNGFNNNEPPQNGYGYYGNSYGYYGNGDGRYDNGQFNGGFYPPPRYDPYRQMPPQGQPGLPMGKKKTKKAPIIIACSLLVVFICAISFLFGYVYLEHIRPALDGIVDGGGGIIGPQTPGGDGGGQGAGEGVSSDTIIHSGFDLTQPDAPGTKFASLADAYEATHKAFVEINVITDSGSVGAGSGIIVARMNGNVGYYIVTNHHVVDGASKITVKAYCGDEYKTYTAHTMVLKDEMTDLAVIAIMETGEMTVARLGKSASLRVGEEIYVIGNPLGTLAGTMTDGIISAQAVEIFVGDHYMELLQTNAAINPGNSGGPMFNMSGEVVGIVNAKYADVSVEGIGFAIPMDIAISVVEQMVSKGYVEGRHDLGISVEYGYYGAGLWITGIDADSALRKTDLGISNLYAYRIESIDGRVFESTAQANIYIDELKAGDNVNITLTVYEIFYGQLRKTGTKQVSITLGQRSAS